MLFLAVFCGFLAEYQLEHKIEKDREKVYMQNMLEDLEAKRKKRPVMIATYYAHLGDRQRALAWLEQAVEERDPWAVYIKVEPVFAELRNDARFQKIVRSAGIP